MPIVDTWKEYDELAPGVEQVLLCTKDNKGRVEKVDAGVKRINGVEVDKRKKHDKPWLWVSVTPLEVTLGESVTISFKITDEEDENGIAVLYTGNQDLPIYLDGAQTLFLNVAFTNGLASKSVTPKKSGIYTVRANTVTKAQSTADVTFKVFD